MDRLKFRANLRLLKEVQGCSECGTHEGELIHHHVDPASKRAVVSKMHNYSLVAWMDEIAKCTVVCKPCHLSIHNALRKEV